VTTPAASSSLRTLPISARRAPPAAVSGRGENDNRVPTTDRVREPLNRRGEIIKS
jgi:hypothetical protein